MNMGSLIGMIAVFATTVFGITFVMDTGTFNFSLLLNFWNIPSVLITIGGSLAAMIIMENDLVAFGKKLATARVAFRKSESNEFETIRTIIALSNVARKEGLLALEEATNGIEDEFLKKGVLLIVDGTDPELVRGILDNELNCIEDRHNNVISFWDQLSSMGPAWGMIGTLIGLVNMLKDLNDAASIGPNMAVALMTTFYGSFLANAICKPIAEKLKGLNGIEVMNKEIVVEGVLSIQAGENPRVIEEKLKGFVKPSERDRLNERQEEPQTEEVNG